MKITAVKSYAVHPGWRTNLIFVKVETDAGIWGGDIVTAAIAHLAHSTPTPLLFTSTDFNSYVTVSIAAGAPQRVNGRLAASTQPGLGVTPRMDVLGPPVLVVE